MLNIGSFISRLLKTNKEVITFAHQANHVQKLSAINELSNNNPRIKFSIVFNFEGDFQIESLREIIQKKPPNLHLYFHPSNRKIEPHILLLQHLTKNQGTHYLLTGHQLNGPLSGFQAKAHQGIPIIDINTRYLIKNYLQQGKLNLLRKLTT